MSLIVKDRVKESTTTTGTGALTLAGALTGFRTFASVMADTDTCYYAIQAVDSNGNPSGAWETGLGTYNSSGGTLTRTTVQDSSNSGSAVNFAAGTKHIWIDVTTGYLATLAKLAANSFADTQQSRAMFLDCGLVDIDKGNSGTSTQTLDYTAGHVQKVTATGNHTIATSNWPPTGNRGIMILKLVNGGAYTITWPTINWEKPDGTTTTTFSTWLAAVNGRTALQTSGIDEFKLWTDDGGTTIYGKFA